MVCSVEFTSGWDLFHKLNNIRNNITLSMGYSDYSDCTKRDITLWTLSEGDIVYLLNDVLGIDRVCFIILY